MLPMTPAISKCTFIVNRSEHVQDEDVFFRMTHAWPGHKFGQYLRRLIPPSAVPTIKPSTSDRFIDVHQTRWGPGWLYLVGGYIGYVDESMVRHSIMAGHHMRDAGLDDWFLRKDGMLHITLIPPSRQASNETLKKFMAALCKCFPQPPQTVYTGIGILESDEKIAYFMTISDESQAAWSRMIDDTIHTSGIRVTALTDGFHVTLGFKNSDLHNINKRGPPSIPFDNKWDPHTIQPFSPKYFGALPQSGPRTNQGAYGELYAFLQENIMGGDKRPAEINITAISAAQRSHLAYLITHKSVRAKVRHCPREVFTSVDPSAEVYIVSFRVQGNKRRRIPDDTIYKNDPELIRLVPRGLTFVMRREGSAVDVLGCVYPTSKFFGDNDADNGAVELASDEELSKAAGSAVQLLLTEKANGEMFTFTSARCSGADTYMLILGSKNNKFCFPIKFGKTTQTDFNAMLAAYMKVETPDYKYPPDYTENKDWTYQNVWLEMCDYFLTLLLKNKDSRQFCEMLSQHKYTACGEYESWLHPHVVQFPKGHNAFKFFALTRHQDDGSPIIDSGIDRLKQLERIRNLGFDAVRVWESEQPNILQLRNDIWHQSNTEGVVALLVRDGNVEAMIKMKTIWYVVHRGIRECLKPFMQHEKAIDASDLNSKLEKKLREKLAIFKISKQDSLTSQWQHYIKALASVILDYHKNGQKTQLIDIYKYSYPSLVAIVEDSN